MRAAARASARASCGGARRRRRRAGAARACAAGATARRVSSTSTESTLGTGRKTVRATARARAPRRRAGEHGRRAVDAPAGGGGEPLADLALHHRDPALDRRQLLDRAQQRAGGDPVGQVRDDLARRRAQRGEVERHRVGAVQRHVRGARRRVLAAAARSRVVDLDDVHVATRAARYSESTPRPPPISSTTSPARARRAADDAEDVGVDEEVLAELAIGRARRTRAAAAARVGSALRARMGRVPRPSRRARMAGAVGHAGPHRPTPAAAPALADPEPLATPALTIRRRAPRCARR